MLSCEIWEILKNIYFEEHLPQIASICFTSKYYSKYSSGKFGLDETTAKSKVSIYFKCNNFIQ